jgi:hypothetical protein
MRSLFEGAARDVVPALLRAPFAKPRPSYRHIATKWN